MDNQKEIIRLQKMAKNAGYPGFFYASNPTGCSNSFFVILMKDQLPGTVHETEFERCYMLDLSKELMTTDGKPCRLLAVDLKKEVNGEEFPILVAVHMPDGQENLCLCTLEGKTRNDMFDIQHADEPVKPISWEMMNDN